MKKIILKKDPSKKTFFEYLSLIFHKIFKERVFITNKNGKLNFYHISPLLQSILFVFTLFILYWIFFTTKIYLLNYDLLNEKNNQVQLAKDKFNKSIIDMKVYRDTIAEINKKIENSQKNIITLLHSNNTITKEEKDNLIKNQLLLSTELRYVNSSLNNLIDEVSWDNMNISNIYYKNAKTELEKNVILNENINLKNRNNLLETSLSTMRDLQNNLLDKVISLADNNIKNLESTISKVDSVLSQVNLKDRKKLIQKVKKESGSEFGEKYTPLTTEISLNEEELKEKFKNANIKVNLWEGLDKAKNMLPLGAPIKTRIRITSPFGVREDPFNNTPAMHTGIDFGGKMGTPLYATSAGKVIKAGMRGPYGLAVEVDHGLGFTTLYAHLSKVNVKKGDIIEEGTKVGLAGSTGRSTGVHLHYELRYNNRPLNPYAFVKTNKK